MNVFQGFFLIDVFFRMCSLGSILEYKILPNIILYELL
jgi:hypothetical protein